MCGKQIDYPYIDLKRNIFIYDPCTVVEKKPRKRIVRIQCEENDNGSKAILMKYPLIPRYFEDVIVNSWPSQIDETSIPRWSSPPRVSKVLWYKKYPGQIVIGILGNRLTVLVIY